MSLGPILWQDSGTQRRPILPDGEGLRKPSMKLWYLFFACLATDPVDEMLARADQLFRRGAYREATAVMNQALHRPGTGPSTRLTVTLLNNLASLQTELENYRESEKLYLRSLRIWEQLAEADRPSRPAIQQNLLSLYLQAGWLEKAEGAMRELTNRLEQAGPAERIHFLHCGGHLRRLQKRFPEAAVYFREAIALAGESGEAAYLWYGLGALLLEQRQGAEAATALTRAVEIHERAGRREHPALVTALTQLGSAHLAAKRPAEAMIALSRGLTLAERCFGMSSEAAYRILVLEAQACDRLHQRAEARRIRGRAEAIRRDPLNSRARMVDVEDLRQR